MYLTSSLSIYFFKKYTPLTIKNIANCSASNIFTPLNVIEVETSKNVINNFIVLVLDEKYLRIKIAEDTPSTNCANIVPRIVPGHINPVKIKNTGYPGPLNKFVGELEQRDLAKLKYVAESHSIDMLVAKYIIIA
jgi:hypothetical protein